MSRTGDTDTTGKLSLLSTEPASGSSIANTQKAINQLFGAVGMTGESDANKNVYSSNEVVADGDDRKVAIEKIDAEFSATSGHDHSGAAGSGKKISANSLDDYNNLWCEWQSFTKTSASGTSSDVTALLTGKSDTGSATSIGVITTAPNNRVEIVEADTYTAIEDLDGQRVYGRLTFSAGTWTLSFYTNEAGTETAHSLSSTDILCFYKEVFNSASRPTIPSNPFLANTLDITGDVVDATNSQRGLISIADQDMGDGLKSFPGGIKTNKELSVTATVDNTTTGSLATIAVADTVLIKLSNASLVSVQTITAPTTNRLLILKNDVGSDIDLVNSDSLAGEIITGTGLNYKLKNKQSALLSFDVVSGRWHLIGNSPGVNAVGSFDATATNEGLKITGTSIALTKADATHPGGVSSDAQTFGGNKTFNDKIALGESVDSTSSGSNQSINLTKSIVKFTNGSLVSIQGFTSPLSGHVCYLLNGTGNSVTLKHLTGTASERIYCPNGTDYSWPANQMIKVVYDNDASRWVVVGASSGSGGGISNITKVTSKAGQTVSAGSTDKVTFGAADLDTHSTWDNANDRMVIPSGQDGDYLVVASLVYEPVSPSGTSAVELLLYVNGSLSRVLDNKNYGFISNYRYLHSTYVAHGLVAGDYLELFTFNNLGVTGTLDSTQSNAEFSLIRLR